MKKKFTAKPITATTREQLEQDIAIYRAVNALYDAVSTARDLSDVDDVFSAIPDIDYALTALKAKLANYKEFKDYNS